MSRQSERAEAGKYSYRYKYIHWMGKVQGEQPFTIGFLASRVKRAFHL
jgi:hypothetical protein